MTTAGAPDGGSLVSSPAPLSRLVVCGLATFHAVGVALALLVTAFGAGALGGLLGALNTAAGFVLFGALWATSYLCTDRALRGLALSRSSATGGLPHWAVALGTGVVWGGVNGLLFLLCLFGMSLVSLLASFSLSLPLDRVNVADAVRAAVAGYGIFLLAGGVIAFVLGAAFGACFAVVDYALVVLARLVTRRLTA